MTLSDKSLESFKKKPRKSIWNYVTALQQLQNALFEFEREENDPDVLKDLSSRALEIGKEIEEILTLMDENLKD